MVRRLSASLFIFVMMVLVLLQQPVLAYCAHTDQFFINHCGCEKFIENACPHCQEEQPADPCDECSEKIQLDTDDLVWFDLSLNSLSKTAFPIREGQAKPITFLPATEIAVAPIRPPPPPSSVPVFLMNSVFRL
ncbi:MAG: hypothetical protein ACJAQT_004994 [Akkermansiaceae bacterium]|jgi:hypothetical protein